MLAWDPSITYEEAVALGGWATPSNRDWYTWIYLVAVIPPALALAGYPDARVIPYLPSTGCLFALGDDDEDKSMQVDKYLAFVSDLFSISLPEFKPPHGKLRRLLTTVVAVMIMHFDDLYKKYLHTNRYVARMIRACLNAQFARNKTDAISLLCFWSRKVKEDFQQSNIHGKNDRDTLRRRTIPDQLAKMNESVVKLLQAKFDFQQQIMELHNRTKVLESEVHTVRVLCQRVSEQNDNLLTAAKITQEQNKRIMLKLGIPVMVNSPGDAHLPPLQLLAATPTALPAPTTAPVTQTQTPRRIIPLTEAVVRHAVPRRGDGTKGKSDKSESVANVLRDLYDAPNNHFFRGMQTGAVNNLDELTPHIHHVIFRGKEKTASKITRVCKLIDCLWTKEERQKIIDRQFDSDSDAYKLFRDIAGRVNVACHVLQDKMPKKHTPSTKATSQMLGCANKITKLNLDKYLPDWIHNGEMESRHPLATLILSKTEQIKRQSHN